MNLNAEKPNLQFRWVKYVHLIEHDIPYLSGYTMCEFTK